MRIKYYKYWLLISGIFLSACTDNDHINDKNSNKEIISLSAEMNNDITESRAISRDNDVYKGLAQGTKIYLRVEGTWTGHANNGQIIKYSTGTVGATENNKSALTCSNEFLYWDDFGTADPNNATTGREKGLTIYGVAVNDGGTTTLSSTNITNGDWTKMSWDAGSDQTSGWNSKDLLISNNIKGNDTYKFASKNSPANLEFTHVFSKITVNLYRGDGFSDEEVTTNLNASVTILRLPHKGDVNITDGGVTPDSEEPTEISANQSDKRAGTIGANGLYATYSALVCPNSDTHKFIKYNNVLKVVVNGNTYYVTANNIINTINSNSTSGKLESGKNYEFNIIVSKTKVDATAQIIDWNTIAAESITPIIIESKNRTNGTTGSALSNDFKMWYSGDLNKGFNNNNNELVATNPVYFHISDGVMKCYQDDGFQSFATLYWPNHTKGYHFRGAFINNNDDLKKYPELKTDDTNGDYFALNYGKSNDNDIVFGTHYNKVDGNNNNGALATRGKVQLTFSHIMSHVTINLSTTNDGYAVEKENDLQSIEVNFCNMYTGANFRIGNGNIDENNYTKIESTTIENSSETIDSNGYYSRASYVIPQDLSGVTIKVIITHKDGTTDTYQANMNSIIENNTNSTISKWESGKKYTYNLVLKKTDLNITATISDWAIKTGNSDVPFIPSNN